MRRSSGAAREPRARERLALGGQRLTELGPEPVGKVSSLGRGQLGLARLEVACPRLLGGRKRGLEFAQAHAQLAQARRDRKHARRGRPGLYRQRAAAAQQREYAVGDKGAILLAKPRMTAKEIA